MIPIPKSPAWIGVLSLVLAIPASSHAADAPLRAVIITGENNHDWKSTTPVLRSILEGSGRFRVDVIDDLWGGVNAESLAPFDVLVLNFNPTSGKTWKPEVGKAFLEAVSLKGKGAVVVHAANNAYPGWREYEALIGGAWRKSAGHGSFHPFRVDILEREHPITRGMPRSFEHAADELYHGLTMEPGVRVLAHAFSSAASGGTTRYEPMAWVLRFGRGRVFHTPLGHEASSMESAGFRALLVRGAEWVATGEVTAQDGLDWQPLFNGKDLSGWRKPKDMPLTSPPADAQDIWKVEDGAIVGDSPGIKHNDFLVSARRYSDFVLQLKVRLRPDEENSGIQIRSEWLPNGEMYGYQADAGKGWWGSLYDESTGRNLLVSSYAEKGSKAVRPNEWNDYEVEAVGRRIRIKINGIVTSEYEDEVSRPDGHFALQVHSGGKLRVEFKDLRIRELPPEGKR